MDYEYDEQSDKIRINCAGYVQTPSIEDSDVWMSSVIDILIEVKKVVRVVLAGAREYEYDLPEVRMLLEIANVIDTITKNNMISTRNVILEGCDSDASARFSFLRNFLSELRYDPIEAYKNILREIRHTKVKIDRDEGIQKKCAMHYLANALLPLTNMLENCELIKLVKNSLSENKNRSLYRKIFHPTIRPNFIYTRYMSLPPANSQLIERYYVDGVSVEIYKVSGKVRLLYHIVPPEFILQEEEYTLLDTARRYIGQHEPREAELQEPEKIRDNLFRIGLDLIRDLAKTNKVDIDNKKLSQLAGILTRYTAGLGTLELLLKDENVQDVSINAPIGFSPIFIFHGTHGECETNIVPSIEDADSWATRFRLKSGRPLDEANPVLDTEQSVPGGRARVAAITKTLSPDGLAFAFRRHREKPWTLPLFIKSGMLTPFASALTWFIIDGARTMLIAGTRSSGKSSLLGACLVQIMPKIRLITLEDTLELPFEALAELGYNIQRLKSRSVITNVETELPAEEGLRTALRLGDSALIVGEVRSKEALALYEAMRIGALSNVVAGTIHGESAYGVFDRVVNDLGVPPTSFKATDIVIVNNMLKSSDGLRSFRRMIEFTEIRKHWKSDPSEEGGFVNLMEYSAKDDTIKPTKTLLTGESVILNDIANRVREWKGNWDAVWGNITLRSQIMETLVKKSATKPYLIEAPNVVESNSKFHILSSEVKEETGWLDNKLIFERWLNWIDTK